MFFQSEQRPVSDSRFRTNIMADSSSQKNAASTFGRRSRILIFVAVVLTAGVVYAQFGNQLSLRKLADHEADLRRMQDNQPVLVYGAAFAIYVLITGLSLPGAAVLSLLFAWYFGFARALLLVSFASTSGATVAFLLSRFLFRETIQKRFGDRLTKFNQAWEQEGPFFLFSLRLVFAVPFFVINAVMGLTPIRTTTFWWVSQLGMLPGTIVYVYAGSRVPDLQTLADKGIKAVFSGSQMTQIIIACAVLGLFPLVVRFVMRKLKVDRSVQTLTSEEDADTSENSPR